MWTSSRTTSGASDAISATASATVAASPTTSTSPSSSDRTPARNSAWSSTSRTRGVIGRRPLRSSTSSTSVPPPPGAAWIAARPPWRSIRPTIDSRTPRRSAGTRGRIEARPAVAHEDLEALVGRLRVDRHGARVAGELRGVEHRLARGRDERLAVAIERRVADGDDVDRDAVRLLDLLGGGLQRGRQRALAVGAASARRSARCAARAPGGGRAPRPRAGRRRASARARASAGRSRAGARRPRRAPASGSARRARPTATTAAAGRTARR